MRKTLALKKNVPIVVKTWHDIHGVDFGDITINGVSIGRFDKHTLLKLEDATDRQLVGGIEYGFNAQTIKVDKGDLLINGHFICHLAYGGLWAINGAFTPISLYAILIDHHTFRWTYSWSLDWHLENLVSRVERIETLDYKKALKKLKKEYAQKVEHNCVYSFDIIEYRGKDYNARIDSDCVGYENHDNFDEKIREALFKE